MVGSNPGCDIPSCWELPPTESCRITSKHSATCHRTSRKACSATYVESIVCIYIIWHSNKSLNPQSHHLYPIWTDSSIIYSQWFSWFSMISLVYIELWNGFPYDFPIVYIKNIHDLCSMIFPFIWWFSIKFIETLFFSPGRFFLHQICRPPARPMGHPELPVGGADPLTCFFFGEIMWNHRKIPSGYVKIAIENGPFIVEFPSYKMVIFHSYVKLPEGNKGTIWRNWSKTSIISMVPICSIHIKSHVRISVYCRMTIVTIYIYIHTYTVYIYTQYIQYIYIYTQYIQYIYSLGHTLRTQIVFQIVFSIRLEHHSPARQIYPNCSKCRLRTCS